jgi:isopentenyl diphosphate isomerase/L-lactate dehydrogenase-like FMN-dependent dehydrogenase
LTEILMAELQTVLFCTGSSNLTALRENDCLK